jgi:muramoyltetrapeptide carboxypeptidase
VRRARKPIVGYSDLTSLLVFVTQRCGLVAFHGPTVAGRLSGGTAAYHPDSLLRLLTEPEAAGAFRPESLGVLRAGEAAGPLFGGTITQLCASLGTPFAFAPPKGSVLFLEDVNERPYRIDRQLTQLRQANILDAAAAIVFGQLPGCDEPGGEPAAREVVRTLLDGFPGPVLWGFPSGHTSGPAWTLPLGVEVRVIGDPAAPALVVEEGAVAE